METYGWIAQKLADNGWLSIGEDVQVQKIRSCTIDAGFKRWETNSWIRIRARRCRNVAIEGNAPVGKGDAYQHFAEGSVESAWEKPKKEIDSVPKHLWIGERKWGQTSALMKNSH